MDAQLTTTPPFSAPKSTNDRFPFIPRAARLAFRAANAVSPDIAAEVARNIFFHPPRTPILADQLRVLRQAQPGHLDLRGSRIRFYTWGQGPAVLLLHGWGGHSGQMTEFVAPLVKAGYRAVAVDARGHGRSSGRLSSLVHFADTIQAAALAAGPFHAVIAHSMGAAAVTRALKHGLTTNRVVLIAAPARLTRFWGAFRSGLGVPDDVWHRMTVRAERWLKVRFADLQPVDAAPRMKTAALILHGQRDRTTPLGEGRELAAAWPGATFHAIETGHLSILRDWRAILASLDFIKAG